MIEEYLPNRAKLRNRLKRYLYREFCNHNKFLEYYLQSTCLRGAAEQADVVIDVFYKYGKIKLEGDSKVFGKQTFRNIIRNRFYFYYSDLLKTMNNIEYSILITKLTDTTMLCIYRHCSGFWERNYKHSLRDKV